MTLEIAAEDVTAELLATIDWLWVCDPRGSGWPIWKSSTQQESQARPKPSMRVTVKSLDRDAVAPLVSRLAKAGADRIGVVTLSPPPIVWPGPPITS